MHTVCKHLQKDSRCGIYNSRPLICREYTTEHCEYEDEWVYDQYFETPEQVVEYMEAVLGPGGKDIGDGKKNIITIDSQSKAGIGTNSLNQHMLI